MEQFFDVVALIDVGLRIGQNEAEHVIYLVTERQHHVLDDAHVHAHHVVHHLDAEDRQGEDGLR